MSANSRQVGGSHYVKHGNLQPWDVVAIMGLDFFQGTIFKHLVRWRDKLGLEDLEKARHYLDKYIEVERARLSNRTAPGTESERKAVEEANGGPNPFKPQPFSSLHSSAHVPNPPTKVEVEDAISRRPVEGVKSLGQPTPKFFQGKEVRCNNCLGKGSVGFSVGDEWSNEGICGMCSGRGVVPEGSIGAICKPASSLRPLDGDLGQRFLDAGVDPKTVDGEEDIHQVAPPTTGIGRFQEPPVSEPDTPE